MIIFSLVVYRRAPLQSQAISTSGTEIEPIPIDVNPKRKLLLTVFDKVGIEPKSLQGVLDRCDYDRTGFHQIAGRSTDQQTDITHGYRLGHGVAKPMSGL